MERDMQEYQPMLDEHRKRIGQYGDLLDDLRLRKQIPAQPSLREAIAKAQNRSDDELPDANDDLRARLRSKGTLPRTSFPPSGTASYLHRQAMKGNFAQQNRSAPKSTSQDLLEQLAAVDLSTPGFGRSASVPGPATSTTPLPTKSTIRQAEVQNPYYGLGVSLDQAMARMHEAITMASAVFGEVVENDMGDLSTISTLAKHNPDHQINQICRELGHIAHLLSHGRSGWRLSDMSDDFFRATLPESQKAQGALFRLSLQPSLDWLREGSGQATIIEKRLDRIQEDRRLLLEEVEDEIFEEEIVDALDETGGDSGDRDGDIGMDGYAPPIEDPIRRYRQATVDDMDDDDEVDEDDEDEDDDDMDNL